MVKWQLIISGMIVSCVVMIALPKNGTPKSNSDVGSDLIERHLKDCLTNIPATVNLTSAEVMLGSNNAYTEERPERKVLINSFNIDATEVTNGQFQEFVTATGYVTTAERPQRGFRAPGGAVFSVPTATNPNWWKFVEGANWKHPEGPNSNIQGRDLEPVVQVSLEDAKAYAIWKKRRLPAADEWEYAAKASSTTPYIWGDSRTIDGKEQANTWQGAFPVHNLEYDGFAFRAPVGCFPPNHFGLYDMIGNVWEWTDTEIKGNSSVPQYTIKGGSFLCSPSFCRRYRASALQPQDMDFTTNHIGFRTISN